MSEKPDWLKYAQELQSIAQAGLAYSEDKYHRARFQRIRDLSVEILNKHTDLAQEQVVDIFASEDGYPTPKVDIRAAVFKAEKLLLVKEQTDNCWSLPGGWAEVNHSPRENLVREVREEAGMEIVPQRIIAIQDRDKHNKPPTPFGIYKIFIECDYKQGDFKENMETAAADFFAQDNLPPLSTGRTTKEQIEMCFRARGKEVHEASFD